MEDLISSRMKLDRWARALSATTTDGRLGPHEAMLVQAEGNVYRALVALKEAHRHWLEIERAMARADQVQKSAEWAEFIQDSPVLMSGSEG